MKIRWSRRTATVVGAEQKSDRVATGLRRPATHAAALDTPWPGPGAPHWSPRLLDDPYPVKVVVTGPFGAGKTTLLRKVAQSSLLTTETPVSDAGVAVKPSTTGCVDFCGLDLADPDGGGAVKRIALFGTPGLPRYEFMWRVVAIGMRVFVVLVDASQQQSRNEALLIIRAFRAMAPDAPFLVAVNRWDTDEDLDLLLLDLGLTGAERGLVLRADVRRRADGLTLLQHALQRVPSRAGAWEDEIASATADLLGTG